MLTWWPSCWRKNNPAANIGFPKLKTKHIFDVCVLKKRLLNLPNPFLSLRFRNSKGTSRLPREVLHNVLEQPYFILLAWLQRLDDSEQRHPPFTVISHNYFDQFKLNMLDLPQAARLSIFYGKISCVAPPWGTWIKDSLLMGERREKKPSTQQCYNRCPTHLS